jgi:hypothetical protein
VAMRLEGPQYNKEAKRHISSEEVQVLTNYNSLGVKTKGKNYAIFMSEELSFMNLFLLNKQLRIQLKICQNKIPDLH